MKIRFKRKLCIILSLLIVTTLLTFLPACAPKEEEVTSISDSNFVSLSEGFTDKKVVDETTAIQALASISSSLGIEDAEKELKVNQVSKIGNDSYYRMQQYYNDLPVYGRSVVLSADSEGTATALTANTTCLETVDMLATATQEEIENSIKKYFDEDVTVETVSDDRLFIYNFENDQEPRLVYCLSVVITNLAYEVIIDAKTAEVIECYDAIRYAQKEFEYKGQEKKQKFIAESNGDLNTMTYVSPSGTKINVYIPKDEYKYTWYQDGNSNLVTWNNGDTPDKSAVDAIANMEKTYNFYNEVFQRDSYDGKQSDINVYVHVAGYETEDQDGNVVNKDIINNAFHGRFSNGTVFAFTKYYNLIGIKEDELSEKLDTVAHEYTHGVEASVSGMLYSGESGAIMEAYSDIFGELVEDYCNDNGVWDGDCDWKHGLRSLKNPSSNQYPETYRGENWADTTDTEADNGGVHKNSTVISHAAYLMWNGIDGTASQKLDTETLAKLWYRAMHLLQSDATFSQCANVVTIAAQQMYQDDDIPFTAEQLSCVKEAFEEVGITSNIVGASMVANGSTIYAMDATGKKSYDNYKLLIEKVNLSTRSEEIVVEIDVTDENGYTFDLEEGMYVVTATDNATDGSEYEYSTTLRVFGNQGTEPSKFRYAKQLPKQKIYIYTDFKAQILATDFTIPLEQVITLGELGVIEAQINPSDAENYDIKWSSSDENVATVSPTGKAGIITTREKGTTTITATLESGGKTITKSTNLRVASKGRDTVLVLDVSGSMRGTPMAEMKQAAIDFCNQLLLDEYNNRVGIVFYDDEVDKIDLTNDLNTLVSYIDSVDDGGMTNMEAGIATAKEMLDTYGKTDSIKNIVIMADGLPNEGKTSDSGSLQSSQYAGYTDALYANAVIDTTQEAMKSYNMYSLGFFHGLYDDELDFATKLMTKLTNQTDGYHQVIEAENLQFAFGDISEEISDGSKIIINIACPVDVQITYNGETLSSAQSNYNAQTSFGSLQLLGKDQDIKVVSLEPDIDYDVELVGTGEGEMNYSVNYLDESEEVIDHRDFPSVPITSTTKITSSTDVTVEDMSLNVDKNGDGEVDIIWTATAKGVAEITYDSTPEPEEKDVETEPIEEVVENNNDEELWPILLVVFGIIIVCGAILITFIVIGNDSSKKKFEIEENEQNHEQDKSQSTEPNIDVVQAYVAKLEVLSVHEEPREIEMEDGKTYGIGKEKQYVDILVTSSEQVSRLHCSISYSSKYKKYFVIDCSANGTFYQNRQRLEKGKRVAVEPGTTLMLADENCKIKLK